VGPYLTAVIAVAAVALIGLGCKYGLDWAVQKQYVWNKSKRIDWREYVIGLAIIACVVAPTTIYSVSKAAVASQLTYHELETGTETAANTKAVNCHAGHSGYGSSAGHSNCQDTYVSGSYHWTTSSKICSGTGTHRTCTTVYYHHSANIYTPYARTEYHYSLTYRIAGDQATATYPGAYLADNPQPYGSRAIPSQFLRGAPADWLDAKAHLQSGDPRPVSREVSYTNYILGSKAEEYRAYSANTDRYLKAHLLPDHTVDVMSGPIKHTDAAPRPVANELSTVGITLTGANQWQEALRRFNAALGSKLQGDLHVVVINSARVSDPHDYLNSLRSYWLSGHFGKNAIAKNGIILVIGTADGQTIDWAQAATAMPYGNNTMLQAMQNNLAPNAGVKQPLTPQHVFGDPHTVITAATKPGAHDNVQVTLSTPRGVLEQTMFEFAPYQRPCMQCAKGQGVGYANLIEKIQPSVGWDLVMIGIICGVALVYWLFVGYTDFLEKRRPATTTDPSTTRSGTSRSDFHSGSWR